MLSSIRTGNLHPETVRSLYCRILREFKKANGRVALGDETKKWINKDDKPYRTRAGFSVELEGLVKARFFPDPISHSLEVTFLDQTTAITWAFEISKILAQNGVENISVVGYGNSQLYGLLTQVCGYDRFYSEKMNISPEKLCELLQKIGRVVGPILAQLRSSIVEVGVRVSEVLPPPHDVTNWSALNQAITKCLVAGLANPKQ